MPRKVSAAQFLKVLDSMPPPRGRQLDFLQAHYDSAGYVSTASILAEAVGYTNWNALNLQYGLLAKRIADALGTGTRHLGLLVEFSRPKSVTNEHWLLVMRPEFAQALKSAGWVR